MISPGFGFDRLITEAMPDYLRELLGQPTCELLELVDGGVMSPERLRAVAAAALEPEKLLADPVRRAELIRLLPREKREELARRLGASSDEDSDVFLSHLGWTTQQSNQLLGFCGLLVERGPETPKPPRTVSEPHYGLFTHQRRAARRVGELLYRGERRVVLHLPTGVGKTRTAMHLICDHLRRFEPTTVVWLAHGRELLEQAAAEFEKAWVSLGNREVGVTRAWGSGVVPVPPANDGLMVMSLEKATAISKNDSSFLDRLGLVTTLTVFDEAHQAIAPTYQRIADVLSLRRDASLLGLTATPGRTWSDIAADEELAQFFAKQKVALEVDGYANPVTGLIDQGYLAHPTFSTVAAESGMWLTDADRANLIDAYDLPETLVAKISESAQWNLQVVRTVVGLAERHRRILLFAASVEHSRMLVALLASLGVGVLVVVQSEVRMNVQSGCVWVQPAWAS